MESGGAMSVNRRDDLQSRIVASWERVPPKFQYLRSWAMKYGMRGLTVHFGSPQQQEDLASEEELNELTTAYLAISARGDSLAISEWCRSVPRETILNEPREQIRGLLLVFEKLGDCNVVPFNDEKVRYVYPEREVFDWSVLPPQLGEFESWLRRFEELRTEHDLYEYVEHASHLELLELAELSDLLKEDRELLLEWCEANDRVEKPAGKEAFQAGWLFLLVHFARPKIDELRRNDDV